MAVSARYALALALCLTGGVVAAGCAGLPAAPVVSSSEAAALPAAPYEPSPAAAAYSAYIEAQLAMRRGDDTAARSALACALRLDPQSAHLGKEMARDHLRAREFAAAVEVLQSVIATHPDDVAALLLMADARLGQGRVAAAIGVYTAALERAPDLPGAYLPLGRLLFRQGRLREAEEVLERAVARNPRDANAFFWLGRSQRVRGALADAEHSLQTALELAPDLREARFERIAVLKARERTGAVVAAYRDLLDEDPNDLRSTLELGLALHRAGRLDEARSLFTTVGRRSLTDAAVVHEVVAIFMDAKRYTQAATVLEYLLAGAPANADLHYLLAVTYDSLGRMAMAVPHYAKVPRGSPFYPSAVVQVAYYLAEEGRLHQAIDLLDDAARHLPRQAALFFHLGAVHEIARNYEQARGHLVTATELEPENAPAHFRLGIVYDKLGRQEDSLAAMQRVLSLEPRNADALNYIGYTYAVLGRNLPEAERLILRALDLKPRDGYITDSLGWVYYQMERYEQAREVLQRAVELVPDDPIILEHLGDVYRRLDQPERAREYYRRSLEREPADPAALEEKLRRADEP